MTDTTQTPAPDALGPDARIKAALDQGAQAAKAEEAIVRQELFERVLAGGTLADFTDEEQKYLDPTALQKLRRAAYLAWVAAAEVPEALAAWAARMTERYGATCRVWGHELPWLPALRVVRWGEEPRHWPPFDEADVQRARDWEAGKHPQDVTYVVGAERTPFTPNPAKRFAI